MTLEQQEDLGTIALSALRQTMGREAKDSSVLICSAIAKLAPLLTDSDTRMMIYEVESALSKYGTERHEWVELLTVLRRVDRP